MAVATTTRPAAAAATTINASKAWAWSGIAAFVIGVAFTWAPAFFGVSDGEAKNPDTLFQALDSGTDRWIGQVSSGLGFIAVASLVVFAAGYSRLLRERMPESLAAPVAYTALTATAGALVIAAVFRAMLFDSWDYYDNSAHAVFYSLSWDVSLAGWTLLFVPALASAVGAFRGALPRWFGWLSIVMAALAILLMMFGLAFPAHVPGLLWLLSASIVSLRAHEPAR